MYRRLFGVLALGLVSLAGCATTGPDLKCKTEVAFGNFKVREAAATPDLTPPQKEQLYEQARRAYQHALELDPNCRDAYAGLARLYTARGQEDKALEIYHKGLKRCPQDAGLWFDMGMCQCRRKDWNAALDCLYKAHELDSENPICTRTLGLTLARAGRDREAVTMLTHAMSPAEANYTVARMLHHLHKDDQARTYLQEALRLKPDLAGANALYVQLGGGPQPATPTVNLSLEETTPVSSETSRQ
jgi:tetratricopeptide (TPR) repeat protein